MASQNMRSNEVREQSFAAFIRQGRKNLKLSQQRFCDYIGVSLNSYRDWEQESKNVVPNVATQNYLRVAIAYPEVVGKVLGKDLQHRR